MTLLWNRWQDVYGHHLGAGYFTPERRRQWLEGWQRTLAEAGGQEARSSSGGVAGVWRVAVDETGEIVGIASCARPEERDCPGGEPVRPRELSVLYVSAEAEGKGVARALVEAVLPDSAPAQLWVSADNARAQAFYRKMGFAADGVAGSYGGLIPEIRMVR